MAKVEPRIRTWDYGRLLGDLGRSLSRSRPREVYEVLLTEIKQLSQADESGLSYILRSAIEETDQDLMDRPTDHLITGMRNALLDLADSEAKAVPEILNSLLAEEHPIYRRLALFVLTERPRYLQLVEPNLVLPSSIYDTEAYHEQMRLLRVRFSELPEELQDRVHSAIGVGLPADLLDAEEDSEGQNLRMAWRLLNALPEDALTKEEWQKKEELIEQHGSPEHPLFLAWFSGVQTVKAPASAEQLKTVLDEGGHAKLLEVLRKPEDYFKVTWRHEAELLWGELADLIRQDPDGQLALAELLEPSDFPGAWRYLNVYEDLAKAGTSFTWGPLLQALNRLVRSEDPRETYWSVAHLLRAAAWNSANPVGADDLSLVAETASLVLEREFTPLEDYLSVERDLTTHQLNAPSGAAADALVGLLHRYALDRSTDEEKTTAFPERGRMSPVIGGILDRAVAEGWGGVELRYSIGQWLYLVLWADGEWLNSRLDRLLPADPKSGVDLGAWRGFWAGHLRVNRFLERIMLVLQERYAILVADAARVEPVILAKAFYQDDPDALGAHLRVAWLRGYEGFGRDGLFARFVSTASDETRAHLVTALTGDLAETKKSEDEDWRSRVLPELDEFWKERIRALRPTAGQRQGSHELAAFTRWLEHVDEGVEAIEDRLKVMAEGLEVGFEFQALTEYLLRYAEREPQAAVRVLRILADRLVKEQESVWYVEKLPELVGTAWKAGTDRSTRGTLRGVVSDLLETRGIDLRKHIE